MLEVKRFWSEVWMRLGGLLVFLGRGRLERLGSFVSWEASHHCFVFNARIAGDGVSYLS